MRDKLTKKVSLLLGFFGASLFALNYIYLHLGLGETRGFKFTIIILIYSLIMLSSYFLSARKYIQIITLSITVLSSLYNTPTDPVTFAVLILTLILMYKYKFFEKRVILKIVLTLSVIAVVLVLGTVKEISKGIHIGNVELVGLLDYSTKDVVIYYHIKNIVLFVTFLSTLLLLMYDEIAVYVAREKKYKTEIKDLNVTIVQTQEYLKKIDANFIDPVQAGLTKKELILLESLCLYRESNIDLAQRLGKSPNTIKVQLTRIMNKIGGETRYQLIDLCRHYFINNQQNAEASV